MTSQMQQVHTQVEDLRLQGQYHQAAQSLNPIIATSLSDPDTLIAGLKLLVLVQDSIQLKNFYDMMKVHPRAYEFWEPELLLRIAQILGLDVKHELTQLQKPCQAEWVKSYLKNGEDKIVEVIVEDFNLNCNGACEYVFNCQCSDCGHSVPVSIFAGFIFDKVLICPLCFVRQNFSTVHLKEFFDAKYPIMLSRKLEQYDFYLNTMQQRIGHFDDEEIPLMSRALNQKFVFLFNGLVFNRLVGKQ